MAVGRGDSGVDIGVEEREECCADSDSDREADAADQRQAGILQQHPRTELDVSARVVYPTEGARVALMFLGLLHTAKGALRGKARLFRTHALCAKAVFEELEVRANLAREIVLGLGRTKRRRQAPQEAAK
jgi:hypothetical protein